MKLIIGLMGAVWLLTGLYPALLLSSFRPLPSHCGAMDCFERAGLLQIAGGAAVRGEHYLCWVRCLSTGR